MASSAGLRGVLVAHAAPQRWRTCRDAGRGMEAIDAERLSCNAYELYGSR